MLFDYVLPQSIPANLQHSFAVVAAETPYPVRWRRGDGGTLSVLIAASAVVCMHGAYGAAGALRLAMLLKAWQHHQAALKAPCS